MNRREFALLAGAALLPHAAFAADAPMAAGTIYLGGTIITMNDEKPVVEALAVRDCVILGAGTRAEIEALHMGPGTKVIDLGGRTLLPSFIDAHSHYINSLSVAA